MCSIALSKSVVQTVNIFYIFMTNERKNEQYHIVLSEQFQNTIKRSYKDATSTHVTANITY